jgi:leucyl aminopeptidase (aminopeptidase T)
MALDLPSTRAALAATPISPMLARAAHNAVTVCLSGTASDRAVVVYDASTTSIAAALCGAFEEIGATCAACDVDAFGVRPLTVLPAAIARTISQATVCALALTSMPGELALRRAVLDVVIERRLRHAHMPSITERVFTDGLAMDYRQVARFIGRLVDTLHGASGLRMTSPAGTDLSCRCATPPVLHKLDGLIANDRWQNLPSGQIIVVPTGAEGVFVADRDLGDWFEHTYRVADHPVSFDFEGGRVRQIRCGNKKLERDLRLFVQGSENSAKISELVIGANLGLTQDHGGALFDGYRPGASITLGANPAIGDFTSTTSLPVFGARKSLWVGDRRIMTDDAFAPELLENL